MGDKCDKMVKYPDQNLNNRPLSLNIYLILGTMKDKGT